MNKTSISALFLSAALIGTPSISFGDIVCAHTGDAYPEKCRLPRGSKCISNGSGGLYPFDASCVGQIWPKGEKMNWMPFSSLSGNLQKSYKKGLTQWDETSKIKVASGKLNESVYGNADSIFVNNLNSAWCGSGGCKLELFTLINNEYRLVGSWTVGSYLGVDIVVTDKETNGMKNILIGSSSVKSFNFREVTFVNGKYH